MCTRAYVLRIVLGVASTAMLRLDGESHAPALLDAPSTLCIEPAVLDFGEIPTGTLARRTVRLINTGDAPLSITSHRASCGCTHADLPPNTTLEAGESREVIIPLSARNTPGPVPAPRIIFLVKDQPQVVLKLTGTAVSFVTHAPEVLSPENSPDGCLTLQSRDGTAFRVLSAQPPVIAGLSAGQSTDAAAEHSLTIDWAKYRELDVKRNLILYFDHPRCPSAIVEVQLPKEELGTKSPELGCPRPLPAGALTPDPLGDVQTLINQGRNERILLRIVEGALDVNARNAQGQTLLAIAARAGNVDLMQTLLNAGADIEAADNSGRTPLMHAATSRCAQAVRLLLERQARVAVRDSIGGTALTWAAGFGDAASAQALLDAGAQVEIVGHVTGWTPLIWAAGFNDAAIVQILIRHGANLEAEDYLEGATPLIHAARTGKVESMWTLMRAGASLEHADFNRNTPLLAAAKNAGGDADKVRLLLDSGANIQARDAAGRSALELAQRRTDPRAAEVVQALKR